MGARQIAGPDRGAEAVVTVVGQRQGFGFTAKTGDDQYRAEDFIAADVGLRCGIDKIVGPIAAGCTWLRPSSASVPCASPSRINVSTVSACALSISVPIVVSDQRVAGLPVFRLLFQQRDKFVGNTLFQQQARTGDTNLALVIEDTCRCISGGFRQIRTVGKHDIGAFTSGLQPDAFHVAVARVFEQLFAGAGRAGKGDHINIRML